MRRLGLALVAASVAALGVAAPSASAEPICKQIGKDGFDPPEFCVDVVVGPDEVSVWAGCDIGAFATCNIKRVTVPLP